MSMTHLCTALLLNKQVLDRDLFPVPQVTEHADQLVQLLQYRRILPLDTMENNVYGAYRITK